MRPGALYAFLIVRVHNPPVSVGVGASMAWVTEVAKSLTWYLGILLVMAGLILPGMELLDLFTTDRAAGTIVKTGKTCEKKVCLGKCHWQRFSCSQIKHVKAEGFETRVKNHAKISFASDSGPVTAWAGFSKLDLQQVNVGDKLDIRYRGPKPYYVTTPFSLENVRNGLLICAVGFVLLFSRRAFHAEVTQESLERAAGIDPETACRPEDERASRKVPSRRVASRPRRSPVMVPRQAAVQRNRGILGLLKS